jgi:TolA-binding protein
MNRLLRVLTITLLMMPLMACDYLPSWVPGAKSGKTVAKNPRQKPAEELPIEQQIQQLQQEIRAVEEQKRKLQQRHDQIHDEKEAINKTLQQQETAVQRMEQNLDRHEPVPPKGG